MRHPQLGNAQTVRDIGRTTEYVWRLDKGYELIWMLGIWYVYVNDDLVQMWTQETPCPRDIRREIQSYVDAV